MALIDQFDLSQDVDFQRRVKMAMLAQANTVANEDPGTENHAARITLVKEVLRNPDFWAGKFAEVITAVYSDAGALSMGQTTLETGKVENVVTAETTDSALQQNYIDGVWNMMALAV